MADQQQAGHVDIPYKGTVYHVRPTFRFISAVETTTGLGAYELGMQIAQGRATVTQIAAVLYHALLVAKARSLRLEDVGDEVVEQGFGQYLAPCSQLMLQAFKGNANIVPEVTENDPLPPETPQGEETEPTEITSTSSSS